MVTRSRGTAAVGRGGHARRGRLADKISSFASATRVSPARFVSPPAHCRGRCQPFGFFRQRLSKSSKVSARIMIDGCDMRQECPEWVCAVLCSTSSLRRFCRWGVLYRVVDPDQAKRFSLGDARDPSHTLGWHMYCKPHCVLTIPKEPQILLYALNTLN